MGHGQRTSVGPSGFVSNIRTSAKRIASNISPVTHHGEPSTPFASESPEDSSLLDIRRSSTSSTSRSSHLSPYKNRAGSTSNISLSPVPDRKPVPTPGGRRQPSHTPNPSLQKQATQQSLSLDVAAPGGSGQYSMFSPNIGSVMTPNGSRFDFGRAPSTSQSNISFGASSSNSVPVPALPPNPVGLAQNPNTVYQQIHDVASKRISTLDYLRKAHEGHVYWFNTLLFTKSDLSRMPYFEGKKLARRATNYLFLGLSLPAVLDLNASSPHEYLRSLNSLLTEFESYQQMHPPDGSSSSSLSRARIPQMFKRAAHTSVKGRRTSAAADIGLPMNNAENSEVKSAPAGATTSSASSFPPSEQDLTPGEEYTYLLTPSLPFDPDFFETFATLCDVLIDCYSRLMTLIPTPNSVAPGVADIFQKADAKLRKVMVAGIIKEFEDASRSGAKAEFQGLNKVVLGGLM